jgi:hypothetical protein
MRNRDLSPRQPVQISLTTRLPFHISSCNSKSFAILICSTSPYHVGEKDKECPPKSSRFGRVTCNPDVAQMGFCPDSRQPRNNPVRGLPGIVGTTRITNAVTKLSRLRACLRCKRPTTCLYRSMIAGMVNAGSECVVACLISSSPRNALDPI